MANLPELRFPECPHNRPVPSGTVTITAFPQLTCPWCEIEGLKARLLTAHEEGRRAGLANAVGKIVGLRELALQSCVRNDERVQALRDAESSIRALLDAPESK